MKVLVTGATGFTGSRLVPRLLDSGAEVRCLVRPSSDTAGLPPRVRIIRGDLCDVPSLEKAMAGMDVLANLASLGFGHAPGIVGAAERAGVQRAIFIGTTAIFTRLNAASKAVRLAAEESIRNSRLNYTVLRPTMIYGNAHDRNMCRLIQLIHRWRVVPIFGNGSSLQQPVYVDDVADAVIRCLGSRASIRHCYNLSGGTALCFNDVIDTIGSLLKLRVFKLHFPSAPFVSVLRACERLPWRFPIKSQQVLRLNEDKAFDYSYATKDFGYNPRSFSEGIRMELIDLGLI